MYDSGKVITGIVIFLILLMLPVFYNIAMGKASYKPEPKLPVDEKQCVKPKEYMTAYHMDLIYEWREAVVRDGKRMITLPNGKEYEMSLTKTCLDCHSNKTEFCDKCHNYLAVDPYCWDCHIIPKEVK